MMDGRLISLLQSLLLNIEVINAELSRLHSNEQFTARPECLQVLQQARNSYQRGLDILSQVEKDLSC